jgi:hypothetical protein
MSLKARLRRVENQHDDRQGWEAPMFFVYEEADRARVRAERERWREEIERDRARGRTLFGVNFLGDDPDEVR